jgi:hypothetical protein
MNNNYYQKYLKYKNKYNNLKELCGGHKAFEKNKSLLFKDDAKKECIEKTVKTYVEKNSKKIDITYTLEYLQETPDSKESILKLKSSNISFTLSINEICEDKLFGILKEFYITDGDITKLKDIVYLLKLEYVIDETNSVNGLDSFEVVQFNNTNIIIPYEIVSSEEFYYTQLHHVLTRFDKKLGICTDQIRNVTSDKNYSINILWIFKDKKNNPCMTFPLNDQYQLGNLYPDYSDVIRDNLKKNITQFVHDDVTFDLSDPADLHGIIRGKKYKLYKYNYAENIKNWSVKNPKNKINLWYDSDLISLNTLFETIKFIYNINDELPDNAGIYLRDFKQSLGYKRLITTQNKYIPRRKTVVMVDGKRIDGYEYKRDYDNTKPYLDVYNRLNMGYKEKKKTTYLIKDSNGNDVEVVYNEDEEELIENPFINTYIPIYFRSDLGRLLLTEDILRENDYYIYTDIDITPQSQEWIFNEDTKYIDYVGYVCGFRASYENSFMIIGSKEKDVKKIIHDYIWNHVVKSVCENIEGYINGNDSFCIIPTASEQIKNQKFHPNKKINNCLNNIQELVYKFMFIQTRYIKYIFNNIDMYKKILLDSIELIIPEIIEKKTKLETELNNILLNTNENDTININFIDMYYNIRKYKYLYENIRIFDGITNIIDNVRSYKNDKNNIIYNQNIKSHIEKLLFILTKLQINIDNVKRDINDLSQEKDIEKNINDEFKNTYSDRLYQYSIIITDIIEKKKYITDIKRPSKFAPLTNN